jgi:hypothetical protein
VQNYIDFANDDLPKLIAELDERIGIDVKNCKNSFYIYDEYLNSISSIESVENAETGTEETTTDDTTKSSDIQQTTEKTTDSQQTTTQKTGNSNNVQQTTNSAETTVATNSETSTQAVSSTPATQQKKKVVSDSYTSSQAIGLRVTSPADSKHGTIVEREKTTTENTTSTEVSNNTSDKKNVTYSKIYEKQDFSILDYISKRTDSIKNELSTI